MNVDFAIRGALFAPDFLNDPESIGELREWGELDNSVLDQVHEQLRTVFMQFRHRNAPNETETEDDLIWPTLFVWAGPPTCASRISVPPVAQTCRTVCCSQMTTPSAAR